MLSQKPGASKKLAASFKAAVDELEIKIPEFIRRSRVGRTEVYRNLSGSRQIKLIEVLTMCEHMKIKPTTMIGLIAKYYYRESDQFKDFLE